MVPTELVKPGILIFTFPGLENAWNVLQMWKKLEIYIKTWKNIIQCFKIHFSKCYLQINFIYIFIISILSIQTLSFETKLTWDVIVFAWK